MPREGQGGTFPKQHFSLGEYILVVIRAKYFKVTVHAFERKENKWYEPIRCERARGENGDKVGGEDTSSAQLIH